MKAFPHKHELDAHGASTPADDSPSTTGKRHKAAIVASAKPHELARFERLKETLRMNGAQLVNHALANLEEEVKERPQPLPWEQREGLAALALAAIRIEHFIQPRFDDQPTLRRAALAAEVERIRLAVRAAKKDEEGQNK